MARYDLYKDVAQAGQIAQALPRDIKSYANDSSTIQPGVPVHIYNGQIHRGGSIDPIIGITCFSPLLINPEAFYHKHRESVSVLTKGRIYVLLGTGSPNVNEFDIAYLTSSGTYTKTATNNKEIGIFLSSAGPGDLVILQFDLSTQAVGGL